MQTILLFAPPPPRPLFYNISIIYHLQSHICKYNISLVRLSIVRSHLANTSRQYTEQNPNCNNENIDVTGPKVKS